MRLSRFEIVIYEPGGLFIAKIDLSAPGGRDDGQAGKHRLGNRQTESLRFARRNERMALQIKRLELSVAKIVLNDDYIRKVRFLRPCGGEPVVDLVMRIGKGLDDERHVVMRR